MSDKVAKRIEEINEPSTIQMAKLSRELRSHGLDIISLSLGEPDFDTPEHIRKAAIEAIDSGYTHYPPVAGYPEAREAVVVKLKRDNRLDYTSSQIVISNGAKQSIINVMMCVLNEGDEIIIPTPYWVSYPEMAKLTGANTVFIETTSGNDYKITAEQLESAITEKTRAFVYSSPCNPTGSVYTREELKKLAEVFKKHPEIVIISDEIYEYINYSEDGHVSLAEFPEIKDQVALINGLSKGFAMTGWRIGYMAAPLWLAQACEKLQGQYTSAACSISERATIAALTGDMKPTAEMKKAFTERRNLIMRLTDEIEGLKYNSPMGAFYLFPDVRHYFGKSFNGTVVKDADDLAMYLLKEAQVSTVSGAGFGAPDCLRISYANSEEQITVAMKRIKQALLKLQ